MKFKVGERVFLNKKYKNKLLSIDHEHLSYNLYGETNLKLLYKEIFMIKEIRNNLTILLYHKKLNAYENYCIYITEKEIENFTKIKLNILLEKYL